MALSNFLSRFFSKEEDSKSIAKERLRLVLVHDRLDFSDQVMHDLREELIAVIGKYMVIDEPQLDVSVTREDEGVALIANIPILQVRRQYKDENKPVNKPAVQEASGK